jgi:hypothetical protein
MAENCGTDDNGNMNAFAVDYIAVHNRSPVSGPRREAAPIGRRKRDKSCWLTDHFSFRTSLSWPYQHLAEQQAACKGQDVLALHKALRGPVAAPAISAAASEASEPEAAPAKAYSLVDEHDIELWNGARLVDRLPHAQRSEKFCREPDITDIRHHRPVQAYNSSMVRSDPFESAKSHFFDTSSWDEFCDVTLTLKQAWQPDRGGWVKIDDYRCRQAFRHFMNLLNRTVYGSSFRRHGKRLRVLPVLEKGEVRARALRPWECGASGRWHIHCAIELPSHSDAIALEKMIRGCWAKVEWGHGRILVRDGANVGWIDYMLKDRQKSEFEGFLDCIIIESLHNPIADA